MDLKFDKMSVDTSLAQTYLQTETMLQTSFEESNVYFDGKRYCARNTEDKEIPMDMLRSNLKTFAVKLKENKNLIAQLEYLLRKIPILDTIAQIDLIIQQTNYVASLSTNTDVSYSDTIFFNNDSPLLALGYIAKKLLRGKYIYICHKHGTQALCHLFTKICYHTGLPVMSRLNETSDDIIIFNPPVGAIGVISELSDIDSAVDQFLASSEHVPWRLQRILVQESVYQQFKSALLWKSKLNKQEKGESTDLLSSDAMEYNGRMFLLDVVSTTEPQPRDVAVEVYRTRKELKLLLNQYRPHYLSLWANDIAEINEIAHGIPSSIIWVNNFGDFRGPPKVSEALFYNEPDSGVLEYGVNGLSELKESWLKLDLENRREILCNALDECAAADSTKEHYANIKYDLRKIDINMPAAFIDVGKNYVCLGITMPSMRLFKRSADFVNATFFKAVLHGSAFALVNIQGRHTQTVDILRKAGVPVINLDKYEVTTNRCLLYRCDYLNDFLSHATQSIKVIWTNSGTIFAN